MMYALADRLKKVQESSTLKMSALAKSLAAKGIKIINFSVGEPDFAVPESIQNAAIEAIHQNFSKYTPVAGIPELREAIAKKLKTENDLKYNPDQVVVSCGAKQAIFNAFLALLNPGDEVLIPVPYWVSYPEMVKLAGGHPVFLETTEKTGYKIDLQKLKGKITSKTKALVLNSPSNPTGSVYSRTEFEALARTLEGTSVFVLSDEIYEKLTFEESFCSFASVSADAFERTMTINGFSKSCAMTGWRLGYGAGPKEWIDAMILIQSQSTSGAASIVQKASLKAFELKEDYFEKMKKVYIGRRDAFWEILSEGQNVQALKPQGAFYFFLNIESLLRKQYNKTSDDVAMELLEQAHVATVAGSGFGAPDYLRISYAVSDEDVREGAKRMRDWFARF